MDKRSDEELIALGEALVTQWSDALTEHEVAIIELARRLKAANESLFAARQALLTEGSERNRLANLLAIAGNELNEIKDALAEIEGRIDDLQS